MKRYRLAVIASHPIQYQAPLFREVAAHPEIELMVYFCGDFGVKEPQIDPGFGVAFQWDIPLLEGYRYRFLPNHSPKPGVTFWGTINPTIIEELWRGGYDAVWVHGYATLWAWLTFIGAWLSRTPILLRGESHLLHTRPLWKRVLKAVALRALFRNVQAFLSIGTLNAAYYRHYGVPEAKLFLTPYAVDNDFWQAQARRWKAKRAMVHSELDLPLATPVILFASKMTPRKRTMDLLQAYEQVASELEPALVLVGDGIERPTLEAYVRECNIPRVRFVGFKNQTELPAYFSISDVFVLPSMDEPWGLVINEAMNFSLPIVATDRVGVAPDLVRHGENGFIYPAGDVGALTSHLRTLLADPDLCRRMGKCSLKRIQAWNNVECVKAIHAAIKDCVPPPRCNAILRFRNKATVPVAEQVKRLHLGCGLNTPEGWINLDGSWNARLAKYPIVRRVLRALNVLPASLLDISWSPDILIHDVRKRLPFQDNSLCAIYCSHLLEHLYLEEAKGLLKECFRALQPGGVLRMVVPDLRAIVLEYVDEKPFVDSSDQVEAVSRADRLNKRLLLRSPEPPSGNVFYRIYTALKDFHSHKWLYDAESLTMYSKWAGFVDVQEMEFHQSRIEGIEDVEEAERVLNGEGICIEGIKPDIATEAGGVA